MVKVRCFMPFEGQKVIIEATLAYDYIDDKVYCQLWETFLDTPHKPPFDIHLLPAEDLMRLAEELKFLLTLECETRYHELKDKYHKEAI